MLKGIASLFEKYHKLKMPLVLSAYTVSGRRIQFVVVDCSGNDMIVFEYANLELPTHINAEAIEEYRDMSASTSNLISAHKAREIYEKYVAGDKKSHNDA